MRLRRRAMGLPGLWRGVLAVAPRDSARICCANLGHGPCAGCLGRLAGAGEALRWLDAAVLRVAKPVECHFAKLGQLSFALSASADEQRYALHTIQRHVFFVAGTVSLPPLGVCERWYRERSHCCTTKCINSGAKPDYCAVKHINNEAAATNNAVVPRARR